MALFDSHFNLLAKGGWTELIGVIVVFGFYVVGAVVKMLANRSKTDDKEGSGTSKAVELAKKYVKQRQTQQQTRQREVRNNEFTSDWDRRQELKHQRLPQHRGLGEMQPQQPEPVKMVPVPKQQQQSPRPKVTRQIPQYREVSALNRAMQAAKQKKVINKQPLPPVRQTYQKSRRVVKTKEIPVAKIIKTPKPLDVLLKHPSQLRAAIILKEILDKPIALREI